MKIIISSVAARVSLAVRSVKFWTAAAVYLLLLLFYSYTGQIYQTRQGIYYLLHYSLANGTREFSLVACALPAAGLFADEWCSGKFIFLYTRTKKLGYAVSIILASFTVAALVCIISCTTYIGIFSITHPLTGDPTKSTFIHMAQRSFANGGLMLQGNYFAYYTITVLTEACYMGIFTALSVMFSLKITNSYIAVVLPMILYILISTIDLPILVNPCNIYSGNSYIIRVLEPDNKENFSLISMCYPFIFTVILLIIFSTISFFAIKKKYEFNSDIR